MVILGLGLACPMAKIATFVEWRSQRRVRAQDIPDGFSLTPSARIVVASR